jgi:hypothetical protein
MSATAAPLLFQWADPERRRRSLFFFILASALLHALCFYVFQIVYPPAVALLPPPARVSVVSEDDPESRALLHWVEAEDPALASTTQRPPGYRALDLPKLAHVPSFAKHEPALKIIPQAAPDLHIPSSAALGSMPRRRAAAPLPLLSRKTVAVFSDAERSLGAPLLPDFTFHLNRPDAPANVRFRVAIDASGAVRFCFLVESSGDAQLDEQARQFVLLCRFPKRAAAASLTWCEAAVLWGNDFAPLASSGRSSGP